MWGEGHPIGANLDGSWTPCRHVYLPIEPPPLALLLETKLYGKGQQGGGAKSESPPHEPGKISGKDGEMVWRGDGMITLFDVSLFDLHPLPPAPLTSFHSLCGITPRSPVPPLASKPR